jgi:hypothetical protein
VIELVELNDADLCTEEEVGQHARDNSKSKNTIQYRVLQDGIEVGFAALDRICAMQTLVLYDLFIVARLAAVVAALVQHERERAEHFAAGCSRRDRPAWISAPARA